MFRWKTQANQFQASVVNFIFFSFAFFLFHTISERFLQYTIPWIYDSHNIRLKKNAFVFIQLLSVGNSFNDSISIPQSVSVVVTQCSIIVLDWKSSGAKSSVCITDVGLWVTLLMIAEIEYCHWKHLLERSSASVLIKDEK